MICFYVRDSNEIAAGRKTAVITPSIREDLSGPRFLIVKDGKGALCTGIVIFDFPEEIDTTAFISTHNEHHISEKQRLQWWPTKTVFYLHHIKQYLPLVDPQPVSLAPGTNMNLAVPIEARIIARTATKSGYRHAIGLGIKGATE